jgi:hypothetical protein
MLRSPVIFNTFCGCVNWRRAAKDLHRVAPAHGTLYFEHDFGNLVQKHGAIERRPLMLALAAVDDEGYLFHQSPMVAARRNATRGIV